MIGIDYGLKRTGLALAVGGEPPAAFKTVASEDAIDVLVDLASQYKFLAVVVGLPRNLDGEDTPQTAAARSFAAQLEQQLRQPVTLQDEAVTSQLAAERLKARGIDASIHKPMIDAEAAAIILQDYIDSHEQD